jgi:hypothetical protein
MGIWCTLNVNNLSGSETLFLSPTAQEGSAACRYQEQLMRLIEANMDAVIHHIRLTHMNAYGIRKGSVTLAASGTACPPPIAWPGEWSMGSVLDVHWHFAEPGDHYLGHILAGLDPKKLYFATLPPHWKLDNLNNSEVEGEETQGTQRQPACTCVYNGHFIDVTQDFRFPKVTLCEGLHFWLQGQPVSTDASKVMKPF